MIFLLFLPFPYLYAIFSLIMKNIKVDLKARSYDIFVGAGAVKKLPSIIKDMKFDGPVVVVTDKIVSAKTSSITAPVLKDLVNDVVRVVVPATEKSKSIKVFKDTIQKISEKTKTYKPLIVGIGGGVVGDLSGFIAATYRRGVPVIHIPTTLLAQVDSSVGGKVGVDLPEAKNLVGAFWQPKAVLMDTDFLKTLPKRQVSNGLGEIIKYGVIARGGLFSFLEQYIKDILSLEAKVMEKVVYECASIKARVVEKDEFDVKDIRIMLNFGHTLGHAIEAASGYEDYNHGESVALGMVLAGEIALRLDMLKEKDLDRIKGLIKKAGLPLNTHGVKVKDILTAYGFDKKFVSGSNRFVLPKKIGTVEVVEDIPGILIRTVLREHVE